MDLWLKAAVLTKFSWGGGGGGGGGRKRERERERRVIVTEGRSSLDGLCYSKITF